MKYLIVSDIHGNPDALEAVIDDADGMWDSFLCLGDITGYGCEPGECIAMVRELAGWATRSLVLAGNHDAVHSGKLPSDWFNERALHAVRYTRSVLSVESLSYLESLPSRALVPDVSKTLAVHGSPLEPVSGYLLGGEETEEALAELERFGTRLCFAGHSHVQTLFRKTPLFESYFPDPPAEYPITASPVVINPGSVGFPRTLYRENRFMNEDKPAWHEKVCMERYPAHYALWDSETGTVFFREARYDRGRVEDLIKKNL